jgi:hypothetical protein
MSRTQKWSAFAALAAYGVAMAVFREQAGADLVAILRFIGGAFS